MIRIQPDQWPDIPVSVRQLVNDGVWGCYAFARGGYYIVIPHEGCCNKPDHQPYFLLDDEGRVAERTEHRPTYDVRDYVRFEGLPERSDVVKV